MLPSYHLQCNCVDVGALSCRVWSAANLEVGIAAGIVLATMYFAYAYAKVRDWSLSKPMLRLLCA